MEHFLPTITSPKPSPRRYSTGNRRILRDLTADIHSCIQQWNSIHLNGLSLLKSITAIKYNESYPPGLQELCNELEQKVDQLDVIVVKLEQILLQIRAVTSLHGNGEKLFVTWHSDRFVEFAEEIYDEYKNEGILKRKVLENVAHGHTDEWKMLHLASWTHQPMIHHKFDCYMEALLNETGHR